MNKIICILAFLSATSMCQNLFAEDTDYSAQLREKGNTVCADKINKTVNWLVDQDAHIVSQWNQKNPNSHVGVIIGSKQYSDGNAMIQVSANLTKLGGCDVVFTYIGPSEKSCPSLRETTFKDWKYFTDAGGMPIYDDPTSSNITVSLLSIKSGCVVTKTGILFYDKDEPSKK